MKEQLLSTLLNKNDLTHEQIISFSDLLLDESFPDSDKAALLKALTLKGETADEITSFVSCFLKKARRPDLSAGIGDAPTIDVCGTGGDKLDLFNVSTTAMFVIAAGGAKVVKHGNRGVTSQSGSSDVLAELGIPLQATDDQLVAGLKEANLCFLFAPMFHPAFKAVAGVRAMLAEEGVRTIFNLIGPLLNPASPIYQMVGVTMTERTKDFATILQNLGRKQVFAVTGYTAEGDPVDEFSNLGKNELYKAKSNKAVKLHPLSPEDLGLPVSRLEDLKGGNPQENAETLKAILSGKERGAKRDIVLLNAGAALSCCEIASTIEAGIEMAATLIDSGEALRTLETFQALHKYELF